MDEPSNADESFWVAWSLDGLDSDTIKTQTESETPRNPHGIHKSPVRDCIREPSFTLLL